jgi:hypothetical protein
MNEREALMRNLLSILLLVGFAGCVGDDGPAVLVTGVVLPDDSCEFNAGDAMLAGGVFDVSSMTAYDLYPVFINQLVDRSAAAPPRANPNDVTILGAEITIQDAAGGTIAFAGLPNPFTIRGSAFIPTQGQEAAASVVIPPAYAQVLAGSLGTDPLAQQSILVEYAAFGETSGNVAIDVGPFVWPVTICGGGCLILPPDPEADQCCPSVYGQDRLCPAP